MDFLVEKRNVSKNPEGDEAPPKKLKRIYIPKVLSDLIWATTKDSTSIRFGFGHLCHKHKKMFNLDHLQECDQI